MVNQIGDVIVVPLVMKDWLLETGVRTVNPIMHCIKLLSVSMERGDISLCEI